MERLRGEASAARQAVTQAKAVIEQAERHDRQALADHARGKRKQAPRPTAPKARGALVAAKTSAAALEQAAAGAQADLEATIEGRRQEYEAKLDQERDRLTEELRSALGELRQCETQRMAVTALRDWLGHPRRFAPLKLRQRGACQSPVIST